MIALSVALCGCQVTGEVENQAYVLVLAVDQADDGGVTLTARVPRIGKGGVKRDGGESEGSPYLTFSVSAPTWSAALDALQWATPRRVNLSHIEMLVVSEALASQPSFHDLMNQISDTPHLYTNVRFVVCAGSAKAFLEAGETVIGTRLSSEIRAMLSQYAHQGYIPDAGFADACYTANGIYGDPVAIRGYTDAQSPSNDGGGAVVESPMLQRFSGAALFRGGRFVHALTSRQTRLLNLIRGQISVFPYEWQGETFDLSVDAPPRRRVNIEGGVVSLALTLRLHDPGGILDADAALLERAIKEDIERLIGLCQRLNCDPFGFAESGAAHFPTVSQWLAFDFHARYRDALLEAEVCIERGRGT